MICPYCNVELMTEEYEISSARVSDGEIQDPEYGEGYVCPICGEIEPLFDTQEEE